MGISNQLTTTKVKSDVKALYDTVAGELTSKVGNLANNAAIAERAMVGESFQGQEKDALQGAVGKIADIIKSTVRATPELEKRLGEKEGLSLTAESIAVSALMGSSPKCKVAKREMPEGGFDAHWNSARSETHPLIGLTGESFKDQDLMNIAAGNITWNLLAARQSQFAEALFPLITIQPDQLGIMMSVRTLYRQPDYRRSLNGDPTPLERKSILAAAYDPTILANESLKIIPNYRETGDESDTTKYFIEKTKVAPVTVTRENSGRLRDVKTSWLKPGEVVDLIAIDQDAESLGRNGARDRTDILDPGVSLSDVLVEFTKGNDKLYVPISLRFHPKNRFLPSQVNNTKDMNIAFTNEGSFYLDAVRTTDVYKDKASVASMFFPDMQTDGQNTIVFKLNLNGTLNVDTANVDIAANGVASLDVIRGANGEAIKSGVYFSAISSIFATAKVVGYKIFGRRDNANRREQGMQFDAQHWKQFYSVPFLSPLAAKSPHDQSGSNELMPTAIEDLLRVNAIQMENDAVNKLFEFDELLKENCRSVLNSKGEMPVIQPIGCHLMIPTRREEVFNVAEFVDSRSSSERQDDIREGLLSRIELIAKQMYIESRLKGAIQHYENNPEGKVTVIVATDQLTASYLYKNGEPLRPIGEMFTLKVVDTIQENMKGKMFITFSSTSAERTTTPNPLTFGMTLWSPEQVFVIKGYSFNNTVIDMVQVAPRWERYMNMPVLANIDIVGLPELIATKVPVNINDVTPPAAPVTP